MLRLSLRILLVLLSGCAPSASQVPDAGTEPGADTGAEPGADTGAEPVDPPECALSSDCLALVTPTTTCEVPVCVPGEGVCALQPVIDGAACDDGDACTSGDACSAGACAAGEPRVCEDGQVCTIDSCDPTAGCSYIHGDAPCDDGNACTDGDQCAVGSCAGSPIDCDDQDPCTADACDPAGGCTHAPNSEPCDDQDACTVNDSCDAGDCMGVAVVCDDANPCTDSSCDPATGCTHTPNEAPCEDGLDCTSGDQCASGVCQSGASLCACETDADCEAFDDGDACNGVLVCDLSSFPFGCIVEADSVVVCASDDPCVESACEEGECVQTPTNAPCNDDDLCTAGDGCSDGACEPGGPAICDDQNPCTNDACDADLGCQHPPNTGACEPTDACVLSGICEAGFCFPDQGIDCDDGQVCTVDSCEAGTCQHAVAELECSDDDPCTVADACTLAGCAGTAKDCDDDDPCTDDFCYTPSGCTSIQNGSCGACSGIACLPCSDGTACGDSGPVVEGTCCTQGDPLVYLGSASGSELVDLETDGTLTIGCGGFGMHVVNVQNPALPQWKGSWLQRCQRVAFGDVLADGTRVVYFAHHGDSWVPTPFLATYHITPAGAAQQIAKISDSEVLFEGMAWREGRLYVATHGGGVRVYQTAENGEPSPLQVVGGFENAWKIAIEGDWMYVADAEGGVKILDLDSLSIAATVPTDFVARDVDVSDGRMFVALGGGGVAVYDLKTPDGPELAQTLDVLGSAQAVSAADGLLGVAAWTDFALFDAQTLALLGTEQVVLSPAVKQVFGVAMHDGIAHLAEWEGFHFVQHAPGRVAPDLWVDKELLDFGNASVPAKALLVRNRGLLPLVIDDVSASPASTFDASPQSLTIAPGGVDLIEVTVDPAAVPASSQVKGTLFLETNDPDSGQSPLKLHLEAGQYTGLTVGDSITSSFGFLDPSGANQVQALKGKVVVLAYFALF